MRRHLTFPCQGDLLFATLDDGKATTGLLIVSGGNEIRIGAHRGMALLSQDLAAQGFAVFRFDRRGIGDSDGENQGFLSSGPDISAALAAFRDACPHLKRIVAFGNCDAATALALHDSDVDARVLANPWVVEPVDAMPPPVAIQRHYVRRIRDPKAWAALLSGKIDLKAAAKGLGRVALPSRAKSALEQLFAEGVTKRPTTILLAARDNTAVAFADVWKGNVFDAARDQVRVVTIESASHSFANHKDFEALKSLLLEILGGPLPG